jgi:hypothetical protein
MDMHFVSHDPGAEFRPCTSFTIARAVAECLTKANKQRHQQWNNEEQCRLDFPSPSPGERTECNTQFSSP